MTAPIDGSRFITWKPRQFIQADELQIGDVFTDQGFRYRVIAIRNLTIGDVWITTATEDGRVTGIEDNDIPLVFFYSQKIERINQ